MRLPGPCALPLFTMLASSPALADPPAPADPPSPAAPPPALADPPAPVLPWAPLFPPGAHPGPPAPPGTWPPPGVLPLPAPPPPAAPPAPPHETKKPHGSRIPGALVLALGSAGLTAGTVFGVAASVVGARAKSPCVAGICPLSAAPGIYETRSFVAGSYASFIAGGIFAAAGIALVIVAPGPPVADEAPKSARLHPWVAPGAGGVSLTAAF